MRNNNCALFRVILGKHKRIGFTLAEMMVVMLILSIIMAAFAPIMTRRNKADMNNRSPWQYVDGESNHNIYFNASGDDTVAMLGTATKIASLQSPLGKFIINASDRTPFAIRFQYGGDGDTNSAGALRMTTNTVSLGPTYTTTQTPGTGVTAVGQGISLLGNNNTSVGHQALKSNTTGAGNVANGYQALNSNTSGFANVANGYQALYKSLYGRGDVANGYQALYNSVNGYYDIANGYQALYSNTSGDYNIANGYQALYSNTSGGYNVANGYQALYNGQYGYYNVAVGYWAMKNNNGTSLNNGSFNTAIGVEALAGSNSGNDNIALGTYTLHVNTSGIQNVAIGRRTLELNTTGQNNIAMGAFAMQSNTTGGANTAYGSTALQLNSTGSNNTGIGLNACYSVTGSNKTCIGAFSGPSSSITNTATKLNEPENTWASDDEERIFIGGRSHFNGGAAVLEVHNPSATTLIDMDENGYKTVPSGVVINGNLYVKGMIIANAVPHQSTSVDDLRFFRHDSDDNPGFYGLHDNIKNWYISAYGGMKSDRRLKNISGANNDGLDKLMQLNVFNFTFKQDKKKMPHVGVIAQDLQKVFPNAVMKDKKGYLMIRWDEMFYCMLNSIKELAAKVTNIDSRVTKLEKENQALKTQNQMLEKRLVRLEKKVK
jgi:prepilin-type N-terminal cleavage/methylation domain-containing protein